MEHPTTVEIQTTETQVLILIILTDTSKVLDTEVILRVTTELIRITTQTIPITNHPLPFTDKIMDLARDTDTNKVLDTVTALLL